MTGILKLEKWDKNENPPNVYKVLTQDELNELNEELNEKND
jgi:hypothetical protein